MTRLRFSLSACAEYGDFSFGPLLRRLHSPAGLFRQLRYETQDVAEYGPWLP